MTNRAIVSRVLSATYQRRFDRSNCSRGYHVFQRFLLSTSRARVSRTRRKEILAKSVGTVEKGKRDRSTFPSGHSGGITRAVGSGGEHREQVSNEEKERDPAGRREREKKERGPRGVEFGWNSSGGGTGGRGPFVVMATAGFHRLIDPPRSRSSTKPQSSPRSHHCLSHHFRNDGAVTTDTPLRTFSTGFVSIASICVNDRPFSFLARSVAISRKFHDFAVAKFRCRFVLASLAGKSKRRSTRKTSERWKATGEQQRARVQRNFQIFSLRRSLVRVSSATSNSHCVELIALLERCLVGRSSSVRNHQRAIYARTGGTRRVAGYT